MRGQNHTYKNVDHIVKVHHHQTSDQPLNWPTHSLFLSGWRQRLLPSLLTDGNRNLWKQRQRHSWSGLQQHELKAFSDIMFSNSFLCWSSSFLQPTGCMVMWCSFSLHECPAGIRSDNVSRSAIWFLNDKQLFFSWWFQAMDWWNCSSTTAWFSNSTFVWIAGDGWVVTEHNFGSVKGVAVCLLDCLTDAYLMPGSQGTRKLGHP